MDVIELKKLINTKDKKSLGSKLVFLHQQWNLEKHEADFGGYITYIKNTYKKCTPKKTKFVEFKYAEPIMSLCLQFNNCEHLHTFITDGKKVNYYPY